MALITLDDKISHSSTGAGSDVIKLPSVAVKRLIIGSEYTVTDAGISAGENLAGYLDSIELTADGDAILKIGRNELPYVVALLAAYNTDSLDDADTLDVTPVAALSSDATPTTAEEQRAWYVLNFPHDLRKYSDIELRVTWRAAADEWGGASAMVFKLFVGLHTGNVPRSIAVTRSPTGSSTIHDIPMGDFPVVGGMLVPGTANYIERVRIKGKDGQYDVDINEPIVGMAMYCALAGATPADDDIDYVLLPDFLIPAYPDRRCNVELNTAAAMSSFFIGLVQEAKVKAEASKGDAKRGTAPSTVRSFSAGANALKANRVPAQVPSLGLARSTLTLK